MTTFTNKAFFALATFILIASMTVLTSYAQSGSSGKGGNDSLDCSKGSTHPRCDSVSTTILNPGKPDTRLELHIVNDALLYVMVANPRGGAEVHPESENLMFNCDQDRVRRSKKTLDYLTFELEQCASSRGFDPLPENWIDSDVAASYRAYDARKMPDVDLSGQWLNLPPIGATRDEQAQGYAFARVRVTITARPRSR